MEDVEELKKYFEDNLQSLNQIKQNFNEKVKENKKFRRVFINTDYSELINKIFLYLGKISNSNYKRLFSRSLEILSVLSFDNQFYQSEIIKNISIDKWLKYLSFDLDIQEKKLIFDIISNITGSNNNFEDDYNLFGDGLKDPVIVLPISLYSRDGNSNLINQKFIQYLIDYLSNDENYNNYYENGDSYRQQWQYRVAIRYAFKCLLNQFSMASTKNYKIINPNNLSKLGSIFSKVFNNKGIEPLTKVYGAAAWLNISCYLKSCRNVKTAPLSNNDNELASIKLEVNRFIGESKKYYEYSKQMLSSDFYVDNSHSRSCASASSQSDETDLTHLIDFSIINSGDKNNMPISKLDDEFIDFSMLFLNEDETTINSGDKNNMPHNEFKKECGEKHNAQFSSSVRSDSETTSTTPCVQLPEDQNGFNKTYTDTENKTEENTKKPINKIQLYKYLYDKDGKEIYQTRSYWRMFWSFFGLMHKRSGTMMALYGLVLKDIGKQFTEDDIKKAIESSISKDSKASVRLMILNSKINFTFLYKSNGEIHKNSDEIVNDIGKFFRGN